MYDESMKEKEFKKTGSRWKKLEGMESYVRFRGGVLEFIGSVQKVSDLDKIFPALEKEVLRALQKKDRNRAKRSHPAENEESSPLMGMVSRKPERASSRHALREIPVLRSWNQ